MEPLPVVNASAMCKLRIGLCYSRSVLFASRVWLLAVAHAILFTLVYYACFELRFEFAIPQHHLTVFWSTLRWVLVVKLTAFGATGQFHGWWRYVSFGDLVALARALLLCFFCIVLVNFFLRIGAGRIPRSIIVLDGVLCLCVIGGLRSTWRLFRECVWPSLNSRGYRRAILVGTDDETVLLARGIQSYGRIPCSVRGLLSTDGSNHRGKSGNLPILGHLDDVGKIAAAYGVKTVLATAGRVPGNSLRRLMDTCEGAALELKIVPPFEDRVRGGNFVPLRDIDIDDLLRREPVGLDTQAIGKLIHGRTVLVTGAGGSIGSEICRQVARFKPRDLVLLGRGENRIFAIERELQRVAFDGTQLHVAIADIRDEPRVRQLFAAHRPDLVFHTAAHKHVPLMETNAGEAVKNNVFGTKTLADVADEFNVDRFVLISTDKAVRPTSVMGATKQIAEQYIQAMFEESSTRFMGVRFGNVLGSAGSVVPIFREQIHYGGPITVTDPRMERYFMTIPEASQLVLQAAAMGRGGEVFVLEMGEPVKIVELARDLIRLSGLPENGIEVVYTGIRPGEKLVEQLAYEGDETLTTAHPKVRTMYHRWRTLVEVQNGIAELEKLVDGPEAPLRCKLQELVRDYCPQAEGDLQCADINHQEVEPSPLAVPLETKELI